MEAMSMHSQFIYKNEQKYKIALKKRKRNMKDIDEKMPTLEGMKCNTTTKTRFNSFSNAFATITITHDRHRHLEELAFLSHVNSFGRHSEMR